MKKKNEMNKVYVRDVETRSVIKEIDVSNIAGTSNYDRFVTGLMHNMNLDKYFLDDEDYLDEQTAMK